MTTIRKLPHSYKDMCRTSEALVSLFKRRKRFYEELFSLVVITILEPPQTTGTIMRLSELFFGAWCMTLMNGISTVMTEVCRRGEHPVYTTELKCCPKCENSLPQEPCSHETIECRCREGFGCQTTSCTECSQLPVCKSGERLRRTEMSSSFYQYKCEKCPSGMDLDMKSGQCKPVDVPRTSPTTKNPSTGSTTGSNTPDNNNNTWIFMCVFVGVFLLLITVVIHLLIHKIKIAKSLKMEGDLIQQHTIVPINIKEDGDTWSYQYPEEEHGDGALNNKMAAF